MEGQDPYEPEPPFLYECLDCGTRLRDDNRPERCPECDGAMQDITVPRE
jgi:rubrerythrin